MMLLLLGLLSGCGLDRPLTVELADDVHRPDKSVVIFFPDGMDYQQFSELLADGRLPNIKKRFVDGGVAVERAFSSLPTVTYPNCSSIITGLYPGHHGILGNFWFDRYSLKCRYYMTFQTYRTVNQHMTSPTLYDLLGEQFTLNIQGHTRRGVTQTIDNENTLAWCWITGRFVHVDRYVGICFEEVAELANRMKRWPVGIMTYYPGVDEVAHRFGTNSDEYAQALINVDGVVGRVTEALEKAGLGESTYYCLFADHGMVPFGTEQKFDILRWLREARGLRMRTDPIDLEQYVDRFELMEDYDAVASVDAGRVAMVHLRGKGGWFERLEPNRLREWITSSPALHELPAVEMVVTRAGQDRALALSRNGHVIIERKDHNSAAKYRIAEYVGDPLGYRKLPEVAEYIESGWHVSHDWLVATASSRFPDFVSQVVEIFDSRRTGDLIIFAADGWALYKGEWAGHGSCLARDMRVPMFFVGPDLPRGASIPLGRLVDIMPTVLGLLGEQHRLNRIPPIDGVNLADQLRRAK